jgi:putative spermidine/putrescine transport system permease protein
VRDDADAPGGRAERIALWVLSAPVIVFLVAPVVIVIITSFSSSGYLQFPPPSLSLQWHQRFWTSAGWRQATVVSLQLAATATVLATAFGVAAAVALTRGRFPGRGLIYAVLLSPTIIPTIITAIGYFFLARRLRLVGSVLGMAIGEAILALPIVVIIVTATLQGFDRRLEQAALGLGAGPWYTFRRVTLPLIAPGVVSAALFAFLAAFDDLLIPLFLGGVRVQTLTVRIWSGLQIELDTTIAAVSAFFVALTSAVLGISALLTRRRSA